MAEVRSRLLAASRAADPGLFRMFCRHSSSFSHVYELSKTFQCPAVASVTRSRTKPEANHHSVWRPRFCIDSLLPSSVYIFLRSKVDQHPSGKPVANSQSSNVVGQRCHGTGGRPGDCRNGSPNVMFTWRYLIIICLHSSATEIRML